SADVSVRSSCRDRRIDSRSARARAIVSLYLRLRGTIPHRGGPIKRHLSEVRFAGPRGRRKGLHDKYLGTRARTSDLLANSARAEATATATAADSPPTSFGARTLRRMLAAFTYRDFRVQWLGACTSSIGTWMQIVAQNWLVLSLTNSAFFLGLDAFLQQLPIILFSLIGGVFADRYDRRRTLMMSQVIQMSTSGALALLMYFRAVQIWQILALSFVTGCAQSFGGPAYNSLIPSLVDKKDLPNAVALNSIQFNVARVLGPLLFGLTLSAFRHWGYSEPQAMNACF